MAGAGVKVTAHLRQVDGELPCRLSAVERHGHAAIMGHFADLGGREPRARIGGHVAEAQQTGPVRDGPVKASQKLGLVVNKGKLFNPDAPLLGQVQPDHDAAGMLLIGDDHLVARAPVQAVGYRAESFGDRAQQSDLLRRDPEESGGGLARLLELLPDGAFYRRHVGPLSAGGLVCFRDSVDDGTRHGPRPARVHVY